MRMNLKLWMLAAAVAAVTAAPAPLAAQQGTTAQTPAEDRIGALAFDSTKVSFPKAQEGDKVEISFPFTNISDRPIRITRVQTSCGCTAARDNIDKVIAPKATDAIKVVFDTTNKPGRNSKTATVYTDETDKQGYVLTFEGDVVQELFAMPRNVNFGRVPSGTAASRTVDVISLSTPPAEVLSVTSDDPGLQVTKGEPQDYTHTDGTAGKLTTVTVTLPEEYRVPGGNYGSMAGAIRIRTTDRKRPEIIVPTNGMIEAPFRLTPPSYMLGRLAPGEETSATVVLSSLRNQEFKVLSTAINPPMPHAQVEVLEGQTQATKRLVLHFRAPDEVKMHTGVLEITIQTPDGATEKMSAPLRASVRAADPNAVGSLPTARSKSLRTADGGTPEDLQRKAEEAAELAEKLRLAAEASGTEEDRGVAEKAAMAAEAAERAAKEAAGGGGGR